MCGCAGLMGQDADGISFEVKVVDLLGVGHHPLAHQLLLETFATYQAQVPMHPDVIVH